MNHEIEPLLELIEIARKTTGDCWAVDDHICAPGDTPNQWHLFEALEDDPPLFSSDFGTEEDLRFCARARNAMPVLEHLLTEGAWVDRLALARLIAAAETTAILMEQDGDPFNVRALLDSIKAADAALKTANAVRLAMLTLDHMQKAATTTQLVEDRGKYRGATTRAAVSDPIAKLLGALDTTDDPLVSVYKTRVFEAAVMARDALKDLVGPKEQG